MDKLNKNLENLIKKDELPFNPNPAIQNRLNYHLQLKNASSEVKQNSIVSILSVFFTSKLLGLKISLVSIAFFTFFGYQQINSPSDSLPILDTAYVSKPIDTASLLVPGDTSFLIDFSL